MRTPLALGLQMLLVVCIYLRPYGISTTFCAVVMVTTDKVYENREWAFGYRELDRLGSHDPYSASKTGAEIAMKVGGLVSVVLLRTKPIFVLPLLGPAMLSVVATGHPIALSLTQCVHSSAANLLRSATLRPRVLGNTYSNP